MCGIVASISRPLERPWTAIKHRGCRSTHIGPIIHQRLPIRDLDPSYDQPLQKDLWTIAFVGEFFGLPQNIHETDHVVRTFIQGPKTFHQMQQDGFWSIVAAKDRKLHLLTDYLGQKPLYYRTDSASVSSEPYSCSLFDPVTLDQVYLSALLKWGYCPDPSRTPYNEVKKVLPGHYVVLEEDQPPLYREVDPLFPIPLPANTLKKELINAVQSRVLDADVPISLLLSTGLDSNIIYHIAKQFSDKIKTYSLPEQSLPPVRISSLDQLTIFQEPVDLGSLEYQIYLAQQIKLLGGERVVLTGDGADELFGGYSRAERYDSQSSDIFHELVNWHLPRLDRVHMRYQQEVRSPFLSRTVVQAALALPRALRTNKHILRELFKEEIDTSIKKTALKRPDIEKHPELNRRKLVDLFITNFKENL